MAKTREITPQEYQEQGYMKNKHGENVSLQYIHKLLKKNKPLPNVVKVNNYSRFYTLEVSG